MAPEIIGLIGIGFLMVLMVLMAVGVPVAFAAAIVGFLGLWLLAGAKPALSAIALVPFSVPSLYVFTVLPLFILMGYFAFGAGLATQAFETGKQWLGHIRGGCLWQQYLVVPPLPLGVTVAFAAVFGKLAIPEMEKQVVNPGSQLVWLPHKVSLFPTSKGKGELDERTGAAK